MTTRRDFLKLGALFVPVVAAPTVAHSFLIANPLASGPKHWQAELADRIRRLQQDGWILHPEMAAARQLVTARWDVSKVSLGRIELTYREI